MKEAAFIRQNIEKWRHVELIIGDTLFATPDETVAAYNQVTSDLAFAQTHYPGSSVTDYLNDLALGLHRDLYHQRREKWSRVIRFWTHDVPLSVYHARRALLSSLVIFVVSIVVGVISTCGDESFPRVILGDYYVEMTLRNIEQGHPMAVYGSDSQFLSFLGITVNNVMVSFMIYVMGIFTSFGTGYYLLHNGIMVGAFVTFFVQRGLFVQAVLAIMLHGTLELSAIVIAGGAGITLGNGWLFPGTYSRLRSFLRAARRSLMILVSTVPVFIVAGFIEGFFTRYTEAGDGWRLCVILLSLAFVLYYYVALPARRAREVGDA